MPQADAMEKCGVCGSVVPTSMVVQLAGKTVCMNCKGSVAREMAGARPVGMMRYAGFWIRFAAVFIDGLVMMLVVLPIMVMSGAFEASAFDSEARPDVNPVISFLPYLFGIGYSVFMHGKWGATLGKMAVKIRVVRSDGSAISYGRALGRSFAHYLSGCLLYIGYIMAAFDKEKAALHDKICDTRVVYK